MRNSRLNSSVIKTPFNNKCEIPGTFIILKFYMRDLIVAWEYWDLYISSADKREVISDLTHIFPTQYSYLNLTEIFFQ